MAYSSSTDVIGVAVDYRTAMESLDDVLADSASSVDSVARRKDLRGNTVGTNSKRRDVLHEQKGVCKKARVSPSRAIGLDSARTGTSRDEGCTGTSS